MDYRYVHKWCNINNVFASQKMKNLLFFWLYITNKLDKNREIKKIIMNKFFRGTKADSGHKFA